MSSVPPILGAAEIVLNVKDISAMQTFYESTLGFKTHSQASMESETVDPSGEPTIVFMTICELDTALGRNGHPQMLVLIDFQRHVFAKKRFTGHHVATSTLNHLAFEIPLSSYEAHKQHLESKGLLPMETTFPAIKSRAVFFRDPEGNTLELICHDPAVG